MTRADIPVECPADLTAAWLTATLGAREVESFTVERIGTGQMSECYRIGLTYADGSEQEGAPASVVLKVAASDPMSRGTGQALGLYEREVLKSPVTIMRLSASTNIPSTKEMMATSIPSMTRAPNRMPSPPGCPPQEPWGAGG